MRILHLFILALCSTLISLMVQAQNLAKKNALDNKSYINNAGRPNIILFVVDDLGTNDAGCYGNPVINTPALDYLAVHGTKFKHAYCTSPSCSPSRSVILTGKYSHATGQYGLSHVEHHFSTYDFEKSLPVILKDAGYRTMRAGKLHVAPKSVYQFDDYILKKIDYPEGVWQSFEKAPYYPFVAFITPEQMAEDLREFISTPEKDPFFLYFCPWDPHRPFRRDGTDTIHPDDVIVPNHLPDNDHIRQELARYYMSAQRADKGLQRLTEILKGSGKWDNTIIVFTSDNGRPFFGAKRNLYDPGIRMPFVFRDPFLENQGITTDAMMNFCDITPTLLEYAGVDISKFNFHGRSFKSQIDLEKSNGFDTTYASHTFHTVEMYYPMRMIRDRKYKLIWNLAYEQTFPLGGKTNDFVELVNKYKLEYLGKRKIQDFLKRPQFELYDMVNDPDEIHNLAYKPEFEELFKHYQQKLFKFQETTNDKWKIYREYDNVIEMTK